MRTKTFISTLLLDNELEALQSSLSLIEKVYNVISCSDCWSWLGSVVSILVRTKLIFGYKTALVMTTCLAQSSKVVYFMVKLYIFVAKCRTSGGWLYVRGKHAYSHSSLHYIQCCTTKVIGHVMFWNDNAIFWIESCFIGLRVNHVWPFAWHDYFVSSCWTFDDIRTSECWILEMLYIAFCTMTLFAWFSDSWEA